MSTSATPVASAAGTVSLTPVRLGHAVIVVMASSGWSHAFLTAKHRYLSNMSNKRFAVFRPGAA